MRLKFLIGATMALAAAALYYSILTAYTSKIVVVPVIKLLSATAATASAMTAASAGAALLLIVGALVLAYFHSFNPRPLPSPVVEINRPWYVPIQSSFAWLLRPDANRHVNHFTRNAHGGHDYTPEDRHRREDLSSRNNQGQTIHTRSANTFQFFEADHEPNARHAATPSRHEHYQPSRNARGC